MMSKRGPIIAVYIAREDGDWDFVAAFDSGPVGSQIANAWASDVKEYLEYEGEEVRIQSFGTAGHLVDVLEA